MSGAVRVGRSFDEFWFVFCACGTAFALALTTLYAFSPNKELREEVWKGAVVCGFLCLVVVLMGWRIYRGQRWIADTGTGFVYRDFRVAVEVGDDEVVGYGSQLRLGYIRGQVVATSRTVVVAMAGLRFEVRYRLGDRRARALDELFNRLEQRVEAQSRHAIAGWGEVRGDGWVLTAAGLDVGDVLGFEQLYAAETVDRHVCVWVSGQPEPVLRLPDGGLNAVILGRLLAERLAPSGGPPLSEEGLGRLLFRRDHGWRGVRAWLLSTLGVFSFAFGVALVGDPVLALGCGAVLALPALMMIWFRVVSRKYVFECYSNGVRLETARGGVQELLFDNVQSFTYATTQGYALTAVGVAFVGTSVKLELVPADHRPPLRFACNTTTRDVAIDELRDQVGHRIAMRWRTRVREGHRCPWGRRVAFTEGGLEVGSRLVPYEELGPPEFHNGYLYLYSPVGSKLAYLATSAPNFYAGFALLTLLMEEHKRSSFERSRTSLRRIR